MNKHIDHGIIRHLGELKEQMVVKMKAQCALASLRITVDMLIQVNFAGLVLVFCAKHAFAPPCDE